MRIVRAVVYSGAGGPEVMAVEERPDPVPTAHEVLVAARFAGLNPADLAQRAGRYPAPPGAPADIPGLEVAGTVLACGTAVQRWREGDRVFGIVGGGGLADRASVHERHLAAVPDGLDDLAAAAVAEAFITAHDAVFTQAGLGLGERLLVNGASGGVGTAAVQLALAAGALVLAGVRSERAADQLRGLGAEPCCPTRSPSASAPWAAWTSSSSSSAHRTCPSTWSCWRPRGGSWSSATARVPTPSCRCAC
jgi:NADPH:quinone reductase-like Zn-dependent oxidoreductase